MNALMTYDEMVHEYVETFGVDVKGTELQAKTLLMLMLIVAERRGIASGAKEALNVAEGAVSAATEVFEKAPKVAT